MALPPELLVLAGPCLALGLAVGYARLVEPRWLKTTTRSLALLPPTAKAQKITILHLSDLHHSDAVSLRYLRRSLERAVQTQPDVILLTGDYITTKIDDEGFLEILKLLPQKAPTFACPGNHDGGAWARKMTGYATTGPIKRLLEDAGIQYLENDWALINVKGVALAIGGMGDLWARQCEPEALQESFNMAQADLKLLLSHNPDSKAKLGALNWDLMLCGHTHGGQFRLPILGAPFAPIKDKAFLVGLCPYGNRWIHVTAGLGNVHGLRFNCRPEISVILLVQCGQGESAGMQSLTQRITQRTAPTNLDP